MIAQVKLRDEREMTVREATIDDAEAIAAEHPLPRDGHAPERLYRNYYLCKTLLYKKHPSSGIITGWVGDDLAGFIFYCADIGAFRRFTRSPGTLAWLTGQAVLGRFGYSPCFWMDIVRWGLQHFRQPEEYVSADRGESTTPDISAWIGTVHTVPDFRRLGVATHLLRAVEQALASSGADRVALWVADDNSPARNLYEARAYEQGGVFRRIGEECILLTKQLQVDDEAI